MSAVQEKIDGAIAYAKAKADELKAQGAVEDVWTVIKDVLHHLMGEPASGADEASGYDGSQPSEAPAVTPAEPAGGPPSQ